MVDDEERAHGEGAEQARVDADDQRAEEGEQPQRDLGFPLLPYDVKLGEVGHLTHLGGVRVRFRVRGRGRVRVRVRVGGRGRDRGEGRVRDRGRVRARGRGRPSCSPRR